MARTKLMTIAGIPVWWDGEMIEFTAGMAIDADGDPKCYHPDGSPPGLDYLANAGHPGNWWALATDNKKSSGNPLVQTPIDPAPGFYISMTAYTIAGKEYRDPLRYVNSGAVPFCVIPPKLRNAVPPKFLGCKVEMMNIQNGKEAEGLMADIGPNGKLGEGSMASARSLGLNSSPKSGGTSKKIIRYRLYPGVPAVVDGVTYPLI